mmetsp:Transcript_23134/g.58628  ORF Transcript_23134/g.58628 Transcript_23134/m.58628 type:complete len:89 (-) Transcript_23134:930-1196(-)
MHTTVENLKKGALSSLHPKPPSYSTWCYASRRTNKTEKKGSSKHNSKHRLFDTSSSTLSLFSGADAAGQTLPSVLYTGTRSYVRQWTR